MRLRDNSSETDKTHKMWIGIMAESKFDRDEFAGKILVLRNLIFGNVDTQYRRSRMVELKEIIFARFAYLKTLGQQCDTRWDIESAQLRLRGATEAGKSRKSTVSPLAAAQ
uniref:Uncharacterized protein n=1 Tax=Magallana gigas TaxID=29159 RepID=K1PS16_MAGGI